MNSNCKRPTVRFTYRLSILLQQQIVAGQRNAEDDGSDTFETVNPFLPFGSLPADIDQREVQPFECELGFDDAGRFDSRSKHVLLSRLVVDLTDAIQIVQVAGRTVKKEIDTVFCIYLGVGERKM